MLCSGYFQEIHALALTRNAQTKLNCLQPGAWGLSGGLPTTLSNLGRRYLVTSMGIVTFRQGLHCVLVEADVGMVAFAYEFLCIKCVAVALSHPS